MKTICFIKQNVHSEKFKVLKIMFLSELSESNTYKVVNFYTQLKKVEIV